MAQFRKTERRNDNGDFEPCLFETLKKGDVFRLFEAEGEPLMGTFRAISDAIPQEPEGNFGITCTKEG